MIGQLVFGDVEERSGTVAGTKLSILGVAVRRFCPIQASRLNEMHHM